MENGQNNKVFTLTTICKYVFAALFTLLTYMTTRSLSFIAFGLLELGMICIISDWLLQKNKIVGYIANVLLMLLYCVQMGVLFFGNSYIELVMLSNLSSLEDLGGKALQYGLGAVGVIVFVLLPVRGGFMRFGKFKEVYLLPVLALMEGALVIMHGTSASPMYAYYTLYEQQKVMNEFRSVLAAGEVEDETLFYSESLDDYRPKDEQLVEQPNVILIFTEGLSQNIIEDSRGIMPNLASLQAKSLNFDNYYNHTFATYRGLIGTMYSGYQLNNLDENNLVSLQSVFKDEGYHTTWINTEPANQEFSEYLDSFGFDEVITQEENRTGLVDSMSDLEAYQMLLETAETYNEEDSPFFISMYTFATHASLYSTDEIYGDGSSAFLDKFYNLDYQIGKFLDAFEDSSLAENTVIIFTADHATYTDNDYTNEYPDVMRAHSMVDEIPFSIYYVGMQPEVIDVKGRNSLGLAPTVLDYLDISAENEFLGTSLFSGDMGADFDTIFNEEGTILTTADGQIASISSQETSRLRQLITQYFRKKLSAEEADSMEAFASSALFMEVSEDKLTLEINYAEEGADYEDVRFAVWSEANDQQDLTWHIAEKQADGLWKVSVDLSTYGSGQMLNIHAYCNEEFKVNTTIVP